MKRKKYICTECEKEITGTQALWISNSKKYLCPELLYSECSSETKSFFKVTEGSCYMKYLEVIGHKNNS